MTQIDKDLANRRNDILWPQDFLPENAGIFAHNEVLIDAHRSRVWARLIEGPKWPTWFVLTKVFEIESSGDRLTADARFRWGSSAFQIDGHVVEFKAPSNLRFTGAVPGYAPAFLHVWNLYENDGGCLAVYEEVGIGDRAADMGRSDDGSLHRSHDLMLAGLKWISESRND